MLAKVTNTWYHNFLRIVPIATKKKTHYKADVHMEFTSWSQLVSTDQVSCISSTYNAEFKRWYLFYSILETEINASTFL